MQLSKRLGAIAAMVTPGLIPADVGTDHGWLPIALVEEKKVPRAIAMDVRVGPLTRAEEHIRMHKLGDYIETRLSDGLENLEKEEAQSLIIAGMGGPLTIRILSQGWQIADSMREWILSPQSEVESVRRFIVERGYRIEAEDMVLEDGKFYPIMKVNRGNMDIRGDIYFKYGPCLLCGKHPVLREFLKKEKRQYEQIHKQLTACNASKRLEEVERELSGIGQALQIYEKEI